jgi:ditrans,polycis-polyprenyl diphosphate synthase
MLTAEGHEAGRRALEHTIWRSHAWGIRALTVFAFSQENFGRPKACMDLFTPSPPPH